VVGGILGSQIQLTGRHHRQQVWALLASFFPLVSACGLAGGRENKLSQILAYLCISLCIVQAPVVARAGRVPVPRLPLPPANYNPSPSRWHESGAQAKAAGLLADCLACSLAGQPAPSLEPGSFHWRLPAAPLPLTQYTL
jgi:hypothetical protein